MIHHSIEYVNWTKLRPAAYNPRRISDEQLAKLKKGICEFDLVDPLIINRDGTIIGGHQRFRAARELGYDEFPCIRLDLDKRREKALNLALNKIQGEWELDTLSQILTELSSEPTFDIELTGFDGLDVGDLADIGSVFDSIPKTVFDDAGKASGSAPLPEDRGRGALDEESDAGSPGKGTVVVLPTREHLSRMHQRYFKGLEGFALVVRATEDGDIEYVSTAEISREAVEDFFERWSTRV
jgi:hypothetical protein